MCATCSRCPGNVREGRGHLNYSFLKRLLLLRVLCERASREKKESSDVVPHILPVELLVVGFNKRNVTLSLVLSTVHNCSSVCRHTQTAPKNLISRSFVAAVYITVSPFAVTPLFTQQSNNAILKNQTSISPIAVTGSLVTHKQDQFN